ncbi:hypothetical protein RCH09_000092 [Actimicrobium sp. GrIS 1.19]|uniref:head GIN domain-containing protein n=1 Tax=Actimicrobium sp. GrIS 1.19 TaxID=3071708 RepID=UPI002E0417DB|nr:hypothetical protein [Actimicrobium sp. GrIS 1.19]
MRILRNVFLFFFVLAVLLVGVGYSVLKAQATQTGAAVTGRNLISETRPLSAAVLNIDLRGAVDLTLRQGPVAGIVVYAEQRMLPKITTETDGATLRIDTRGLIIGNHGPMMITVTLPTLENVAVSGSGDANVEGFSGNAAALTMAGSGDVLFNGQFKKIVAQLAGSGDLHLAASNSEQVEIRLLGSGNVDAVGQCQTVQATLAGSGDLDAGRLQAEQVTLALAGSGNGTVFARKLVTISLNGSGDVDVRGAPARREVHKSGSGDVRFE